MAKGNSVVEDVLVAGDCLVKDLPTRLLHGRVFEEFPDNEVPFCDKCGKPCEWVYFSSAALKKLQGAPVNWCGGCLDAHARVRDGAQQWKAHARMGLHEHLSALKRLRPQASGPNPQAAGRRSLVLKGDERAPAAAEQAAVLPMQMMTPPPAVPLLGKPAAQGAQQQQQQQGSVRLTAAKPPLPEKVVSQARAKVCDNMRTVLAHYFVRGRGEDFRTSGAEIVARYRKHFRCPAPQWKQVYQVLTSLGFHCTSETVPSGQGAAKQLTRVVCGLKPKSMS